MDGSGIEPNAALLPMALPRCASMPPLTTERRPGRGGVFHLRRLYPARVGRDRLSDSAMQPRQFDLPAASSLLQLVAKLLGFSAYSDSKGSSKFTRHYDLLLRSLSCRLACARERWEILDYFFKDFPSAKPSRWSRPSISASTRRAKRMYGGRRERCRPDFGFSRLFDQNASSRRPATACRSATARRCLTFPALPWSVLQCRQAFPPFLSSH